MKTESIKFPSQNSNNCIVTNKTESRIILLCGILSTLFFVGLFALKPTLLQPLDFKNYDLLLRNFPNNFARNRPVIIAIDEKSLRRYGQWPWPRYQVAELFEKIAALKPAVVGLDMIFAEPDRTSVERLLKNLGNFYHEDLSYNRLPVKLCDNDCILAETLSKGPFVLGNKFHFNKLEKSSKECVLHPVRVSLIQKKSQQNNSTGIPESTGVLCNLKILSQKVSASGFLNFSSDQDGVLRRLPLLIQLNGEFYPCLALATVLKLKSIYHLLLKKDGEVLQTLNYKGTSVPVDRHGQMLIKFRGEPRHYDHISAADIMDGSVSSKRLQERIAFVGASATGLQDLLTTPFDPILPGVDVHATVVDNLLTGDFIAVPSWSNGLVLFFVLVFGVSLSLVIAFNSAPFGFFIMLIFIVGMWVATQQAFFRMGFFIGTAYPIASTLCSYMILSVFKYRLDEKKILSALRELLLTQDVTIELLANLTESRDQETGGHIKRTRRYIRLLAEHIRSHDKYKNALSDEYIDMLYKSAPLHDIGKVGIPDNILLKPYPLTEKEFEVIKSHTFLGSGVIESSARKLGKKSFLTFAAEIAYSHHEKWDGSGYPLGLKGDEIPISGRLMALADVYDAITSKRVYKLPSLHANAVNIIKKGSGTHFDPDMVNAFLEIHEQFKNIAWEFSDDQEGRNPQEQNTPPGDATRNT